MTMKDVCRQTGLSYETLRFYCDQGLVPNIKRDKNNYRVFDDRNVAWIQSLLCLRKCGMGIEEMKAYLLRMDFILGVQATCPNNCGVLSFGDTLYINFIRNIKEPELEARFCNVLKQLGLTPKVESNQR